jgi:hypothetical protein
MASTQRAGDRRVSFWRQFGRAAAFRLPRSYGGAVNFVASGRQLAGAMTRVWGGWLVCLAVLSAPLAAKDEGPLMLPKGARIGVVTLLHPEVTHFHSSKSITDQALKTEIVDWPVDGMLVDAIKDRAGQMGLTLVPLPPTDELEHAREDCFLNNGFNRTLPKDCVLPFAHLLANQQLQGVIVLAPGLNNSTHAGGSARRKDLPDYLRGWGFVTGIAAAPDGKPTLFSMTELLLVVPSPEGPALRAHEWGGIYTLEWTNFVAPLDLKSIPYQSYGQLQPLFAAILSRQGARLLDQVTVAP